MSESTHQAKLAEALAKLPVDERKAIKAVDPERLMRRANKKKNKVLGERFERKQANADKATGILGRPSRGMERARKEKKVSPSLGAIHDPVADCPSISACRGREQDRKEGEDLMGLSSWNLVAG